MTKRKRKKRIALVYPLAVPHLARFTQGVSDFARAHGNWAFIASPAASLGLSETLAITLENLKGWDGDGAIAAVTTPDQEQSAFELGIPVVNLSGALRESMHPRVTVDQESIGRMAAEHLLESGLKRFAFAGMRGVWFSKQRCCGFIERIAEAGHDCDVFETECRTDADDWWRGEIREIDSFLQKLRPPVGIFAVHDYRARILIDECEHVGLEIPNDVALLGVDNDETVCEFCEPPLSSVARNGRRAGYEAARLLDQLMAGNAPPPSDVLIPPDGVVCRRSTDVFSYDDPDVTTCARYIRDHVDEIFGVERLLQQVSVSRRTLEMHFKRCTGQTLCDTITRQRVRRAMELLRGSEELPVENIAAASGFSDSRALRRAFKRVTGTTPKAWNPGSYVGS